MSYTCKAECSKRYFALTYHQVTSTLHLISLTLGRLSRQRSKISLSWSTLLWNKTHKSGQWQQQLSCLEPVTAFLLAPQCVQSLIWQTHSSNYPQVGLTTSFQKWQRTPMFSPKMGGSQWRVMMPLLDPYPSLQEVFGSKQILKTTPLTSLLAKTAPFAVLQ